jgi:hypothetical protein
MTGVMISIDEWERFKGYIIAVKKKRILDNRSYKIIRRKKWRQAFLDGWGRYSK